MRITEEFYATGHPNVVAGHPTTFEITREANLSKRGDCVLAVNSTKAAADFSDEFRRVCRNDGARVLMRLEAKGIRDLIQGWGSARLTITDSEEIVGRTSTYVSPRTVMVRANKAARDLRRDLIIALKSPETRLRIQLTAEI